MKSYWLKITLLSDAVFGRGDGVAGLVDSEVQHDRCGLPYLSGKTLKGLLMAEAAEILSALRQAAPSAAETMTESAGRLFGRPGSRDEQGILHVGDAKLPEDLRLAVQADFARLAQSIEDPAARERALGQLRAAVLDSLTAIRRQTAIDATTGAPRRETLRSIRTILRETPFEARLDFMDEPDAAGEALLAACVMAFRRLGTGRHRGLGKCEAELANENREPVTGALFENFERIVQG